MSDSFVINLRVGKSPIFVGQEQILGQRGRFFYLLGNFPNKLYKASVGKKGPQNQAFCGQGVREISRPRSQIFLD